MSTALFFYPSNAWLLSIATTLVANPDSLVFVRPGTIAASQHHDGQSCGRPMARNGAPEPWCALTSAAGSGTLGILELVGQAARADVFENNCAKSVPRFRFARQWTCNPGEADRPVGRMGLVACADNCVRPGRLAALRFALNSRPGGMR
jgi:hypothetical protein